MTQALNNNIISALGLDELPPDKKAALVKQMMEIVQMRAALRVIKTLPKEALDEYSKIVDNSEIEANEFLARKIPDFERIIEEETAKFKEEIIN